ncbi:hypothetical protein [Nitrosomonas eutropha]|uniref:Lipopolysaccharide assembly protein A domain-containing protein n=2 Tax=Nitrosomonas eutropha TaxID=916 RepID=A0ABX5M867_9PROT|nr:hypothetical protein [Nitrosomonas eutropha]ABI59731.1 hypothetical protein Neut_1486 [Nitrosomonas eutropha C91]PXV82469.1 hypothetical protein C8R14_10741 [Nitrosomonas eutropha]
MQQKSKSKNMREAELSFLKLSKILDVCVQLITYLIKWSVIAFVTYYVYLSIISISGKNTSADIAISVLFELELLSKLMALVGVGGTIYGFLQRKLRKDTIERLQTRITELEKDVDQNRSSSNLTKRGDTRLEDR